MHKKLVVWCEKHLKMTAFVKNNSSLKENQKITLGDNIAVAFSGLMLGTFGAFGFLDVCAHSIENSFKPYLSFFALLCFAIWIGFTFYQLIQHKNFFFDVARHDLLSSVLPTFSMSWMCFAGYLATWSKTFTTNWSSYFWLQVFAAFFMVLACFVHIIILVVFYRFIFFKHQWKKEYTYSTWFLPSVGIATASNFTLWFDAAILPNLFFQVIWYFAFINYVVHFPILSLAAVYWNQITPNNLKAQLAVFVAPMGLVVVSWCNTFALEFFQYAKGLEPFITVYNVQYILGMTWFLICWELIMNLVLIVLLIMIWKTKFNYLFASTTFPMIINSVAFVFVGLIFRYYSTISKQRTYFVCGQTFYILGFVLSVISAMLICLIFCFFIFKMFKDKKEIIRQNKNLKQNLQQKKCSLVCC